MRHALNMSNTEREEALSRAESKLQEIAALQMLFKTDVMKACVLTILHKAVKEEVFWTDEIAFDFVGEKDRKVIGISFKLLGPKDKNGRGPGMEMILKTGSYRQSQKEE